MIFWIVLVGILLALWLLGQIRVGAIVTYSETGFCLTAKVGPKRIQIIPSKTSKKENAQKKKAKVATQSVATDEADKSNRSAKDTVSLALHYLPLVGDAAGRLKRKIRIDNVVLCIIWGASDPADAAREYGAANAAMGILWPVVEHNFRVKEHDLSVHIDFDRETPELLGDAQITITVGQILALIIFLGAKALKIHLGIRRDKTPKNQNEKAVQA